MAYASRSGRARTSISNPTAHAICDRCGFRYNNLTLRWQFDWAGASMINTGLLVCPPCYDQPQQQLRSVVVPADPVPIQNPRIEPYNADETSTRYTSGQNTVNAVTNIPVPGGARRTTQDGKGRVTQQTGEPPGGKNQRPGTDPNAPGNSNPGLPYDNTEVPQTGPLS